MVKWNEHFSKKIDLTFTKIKNKNLQTSLFTGQSLIAENRFVFDECFNSVKRKADINNVIQNPENSEVDAEIKRYVEQARQELEGQENALRQKGNAVYEKALHDKTVEIIKRERKKKELEIFVVDEEIDSLQSDLEESINELKEMIKVNSSIKLSLKDFILFVVEINSKDLVGQQKIFRSIVGIINVSMLVANEGIIPKNYSEKDVQKFFQLYIKNRTLDIKFLRDCTKMVDNLTEALKEKIQPDDTNIVTLLKSLYENSKKTLDRYVRFGKELDRF